MTETLSLGYMQAEAAGALRRFRRLYALNLAIQSVVALLVLVAPRTAAALTGVPHEASAPFMALWAALTLVLSALQLPGWMQPIRNRFLVGAAVYARLFTAVVYLVLGMMFIRLAIFDAVFAVVLAVAFHRALIAELQTRP